MIKKVGQLDYGKEYKKHHNNVLFQSQTDRLL